jgi:hypothetical protein
MKWELKWNDSPGFKDYLIIRQINPNNGNPCIETECSLPREDARALAKELWYEFGEIDWT